jgi:CMP-N-acetylneuraminic acid synthetase
MKIVGIIPVKKNSERVKGKNLRKFSNTSLFELKLKQLDKTKSFDDFYVSSESKSILEKAKSRGFKTHLRDPYYSTSSVPMSEVYKYVASSIKADHVAWINVTNPLIDHKIYDQAANIYKKNNFKKYDCVLSAIKNKENFFYKGKPINFKRSPWPRSQDLEPLISLPFAISMMRRNDLIKWKSCVGKKPKFFFLDPVLATDIDEMHNFKFAEFIYNSKKN